MSRDLLEVLCRVKPKQWPKWLLWVELWFNTTYIASTQTSPFKALYRREPLTLIKGDVLASTVEEVTQLLAERNSILEELKW